jgi:thioredoxin reductase/NAD-dependent dihydropyrimidine dehydrogenase PreA subunit
MTSDPSHSESFANLALALLYLVPLAAGYALWSRAGRKSETRARSALANARAAGLDEPATLHPEISPSRCLGCGACVGACPEGDVLGIVAGKAELVNPANCIGHGACQTACPYDAITLVLGTARRGVEIPKLGPDFQTATPGVFVAGELGGMGLIRNAIEQGRQVIEAVRQLPGMGSGTGLDLAIVGAGPAGLAASLAAKQRGLRFVTLEQESLGGTVAHYPRGKIVMTAPAELPLYGKLALGRTTKEALLRVFRDVVTRSGLGVHYGERVEAISRGPDGFALRTSRGSYNARSVVLAIGRRGSPAKLGVPGEEAAHVVYRLIDPEQYRGQQVLVVGGGDSALEAAAELADQPDTRVTLSYRGSGFSRAKPANRARVEGASSAGRLSLRLESKLVEIRAQSVLLACQGRTEEVPADAVIACTGGVLPSEFLRAAGVATEVVHGRALR